ncbi:unnamed protein product [Pneumocystis jirovecii]|uniref:Uncharacterized protein n=1 Tax=Pneumocystis jirovecii TaxID=42068 RepID=L0PCW5_PNEJI|nr:unnamed protein product [Pneumocystis jirovecii]
MFDEDLLIKNRLLIEERPLKKVLKRCSSIIEHHYNATHEFQESLNNQINIDFTYFELTIKRLASLWKTNKLEIFNYSNEKLELDKMILSTKTNIYQLYDKLYQAQKIKLNKLEYNKLTNEIQSDQPKDRKTLQEKSQFAETIITLQAISNNIQTEKEQEKSKGLTETEIQE